MEARYVQVVDAAKEWDRGVLGWFLRYRGILVAVGGELGVGTIGWFLVHWQVGLVFLEIALFTAVGLWAIRYYRIRRVDLDNELHAFCHHLRDCVAEIQALTDGAERNARIRCFHSQAAQQIASFFRSYLGEKWVSTEIWLAEVEKKSVVLADGTKGTIEKNVYTARAWSDRMDANRMDMTKPIDANTGLPAKLRQGEPQGVYVIPSLDAARLAGIWQETGTEGLADVHAMMVTPINGWDNGAKAMLGILFVNARKDIFRPVHVPLLMAFADALGICYPLLANVS